MQQCVVAAIEALKNIFITRTAKKNSKLQHKILAYSWQKSFNPRNNGWTTDLVVCHLESAKIEG